METGEEIAIDIARHLKVENYEFTVNVNGNRYDVYHFKRAGKIGQIAVSIIGGKAVIAAIRVGRGTEEEMELRIAEGEAKQ